MSEPSKWEALAREWAERLFGQDDWVLGTNDPDVQNLIQFAAAVEAQTEARVRATVVLQLRKAAGTSDDAFAGGLRDIADVFERNAKGASA